MRKHVPLAAIVVGVLLVAHGLTGFRDVSFNRLAVEFHVAPSARAEVALGVGLLALGFLLRRSGSRDRP